MRSSTCGSTLAKFLAALALHGCAGGESSKLQSNAVVWTSLGEVSIGDDGKSAWVELPVDPEDRYHAIRVTPSSSEVPVCLRPEPVELASGEVWVEPWSPGDDDAVCARCSEPVFAQRGFGMFVFPSATTLATKDTLRLRIQLLDCDLFIPVSRARIPSLPNTVRFETATERTSSTGSPTLEVWVGHQSDAYGMLDDRDAAWNDVFRLFDEVGIALEVVGTSEVHMTGALEWSRGASAPYAALLEQIPHRERRIVPIVVVPCLLDGGVSIPGVTSRIPGGINPQASSVDSAVFMSTGCGAEFGTGAVALRLAHEIGHYLGLFHSDSPAGASVAPEGSVMNARPILLAPELQHFTPEQAAIMMRHPDVFFRP